MPDTQQIPEAPVHPEEVLMPPQPERCVLFLSHATPQDSAFARWLATQLASAGHEVWCDVTQLLGGETFWNDINDAIEKHTFRLLFASTLHSNSKQGTLKELRIAADVEKRLGLRDFIVPLKVDAFPHESTHEIIRERNFVPFEENWGAGLTQLLKLLEREGAPISSVAGPKCVIDWYRRTTDERRKIVVSNERCLSNWFELRLPKHLFLHRAQATTAHLGVAASGFRYPYRVLADFLVTFAARHEAQEQLGPRMPLVETIDLNLNEFIEKGYDVLAIKTPDAQNFVSDLIRQAWEKELTRRGLLHHELASGTKAWFFKLDNLPKNRAYLHSVSNRQRYRQLVGKKTKRRLDGTRVPDGYWHYGVSISPQIFPYPRLVLRHHVVFTDDGAAPWQNADRMHRARRRVCKNWWNADWRDRVLAFARWLAPDNRSATFPVGDHVAITMAAIPTEFVSPWTYFEGPKDALDESNDIELVEEEEDGDEEPEEP